MTPPATESTDMTIRLYCFGESGNAYKAALALELSGLAWTPVKVDFFGGETRSAHYRSAVNAMGEAPVLVDGDTRLTQSGVIQDYVTERSGRFGGANTVERREVWRWVLWDNHKPVSYTHLRAHETVLDLVCRLLLEKKKTQ